jgi:hypothetical protein
MTTHAPVDIETVEATGYENDDGTLYGYANHRIYERNPGAVPVRIVRERDWQAIRQQLTARDELLRDIQKWFNDKRMGTYQYMEGSGFYEDKGVMDERITDLLGDAP